MVYEAEPVASAGARNSRLFEQDAGMDKNRIESIERPSRPTPRVARTGRTNSPLGMGRGYCLVLFVLATLILNCRKLTAQPTAAKPIPPGPFEITEFVYDGELKPGWQDWGWGPHELGKGPARLNLSQYGGWILHHDTLTTRYGALTFRMKAPVAFGKFLQVQLAAGQGDSSFPAVDVSPERTRKGQSGWLEVYIPWGDLSPSGAPFDRIVVHAKSSVGPELVLFDKFGLTRFDSKAAAAAIPNKNVSLVVSCSAPTQAISPYIYGIAADTWSLGATARRWGGNPTTRYNWQINAYNTGKDWFFENQNASDYRTFLSENLAHHWVSALTVPIIGWVAKDSSSVGFPKSLFPAQQSEDPGRHAGDGMGTDGKPITPGPASQTSVAASPEFMKRWLEAIKKQDETTGTRSVHMYILDNEPNLWNANHRDVHPNPLTYDELLDRTLRYGAVIRATDPQALIAGPAEWGWTGYLYSAQDAAAGVGSRPDRRAHGDLPLIPWYLKKLHERDLATGSKSLDVLDVHFYPQQNGVYGGAADPATAALRIRSTRSLWDPSYKDESWINDTIRLIPRLKEWVAQNYPGLGISIGEYNFGGEQHMSGALALAEALGRFGSGGVTYAFYWLTPPVNSPAYWAFRAYRNFDGQGGHFLEESVPTQMAPNVSLFASRDKSGKHLVLIALNLDPASSAQAAIKLDGCGAIAKRRRFNYDGTTPQPSDEGVATKPALDERLPPYSINVFDIELK